MTVVCQVLASKVQIVPAVLASLMPYAGGGADALADGQAQSGAQDRRFVGTIKSFNKEKGYGFIACAEVKEAYGTDVFIHHHQLGPFAVGSEVSFLMSHSKDGQ